jgi:phospholipase/carboxylesterase
MTDELRFGSPAGGLFSAAFSRPTLSRGAFLRASAAMLAPGMASACTRDLTGVGTGPVQGVRLTARPGEPTTEPEVGIDWININRTGRDARLCVPSTYDPETPAPLLVTLHGRGGGAVDWDGFEPACEARGMVMLAVESRSVTWDRVGAGYFGPDVAYIDRALALVFDRCRIDPDRIALAGFSDGASYALSLGPSNGDLFGHLIAYSPGLSRPGSEIVGQPLIWVSHGRDDQVLSPERTEQIIIGSLLDAGYLVEYVPFEGGHEVPGEIATQSLDWFLG